MLLDDGLAAAARLTDAPRRPVFCVLHGQSRDFAPPFADRHVGDAERLRNGPDPAVAHFAREKAVEKTPLLFVEVGLLHEFTKGLEVNGDLIGRAHGRDPSWCSTILSRSPNDG